MADTIDRRSLFRGLILTGAAVAAGTVLGALDAEALPLDGHAAPAPQTPFAKAQVVVVAPRRRRRRWVCWWNRGRRVCGWRWF